MTFDDLFALTPDGPGRWTAPGAPPTDERIVFGGLVVGQAIVAASMEARRCHSLHAFFIGMGEKQRLFEISVEHTRDGGSFDTRHIQIRQGERLLLAGLSSHHQGNDGPQHEIAMPDVPPPDSVEDYTLLRARQSEQTGKPMKHYLADRMLKVRRLDAVPAASGDGALAHPFWTRSRQPIRGDNRIHQAAIGFASDLGLVPAGLQNHPRTELQTASLDHSIWFHREAAADEWMLQVMHSPVARDGRGLSLGSIFNQRGELVASVAQEFLARAARPQT